MASTPKNDTATPDGRGEVALTADIVAELSAELFGAYRRGGLHNLLPNVAVRGGKEEVTPWNPPSGKLSGGEYTLGVHPVYNYRGSFGPQYKIAFHLGSDKFAAGVKRRVLAGLQDRLATVLLAAIRSNEVVRAVLKQRELDLDTLETRDLLDWTAVTVGRYARLMNGSRKVQQRRVLSVGAPVRNVTARKHSLGCVTAFVRQKDAVQGASLHALSASHVITDHGRARLNTSIHSYVVDPAAEVGTYNVAPPFEYVPESTVSCDAATAELLPKWRGVNMVKFAGRQHQLVDADGISSEDLDLNAPSLAVVGHGGLRREAHNAATGKQLLLDEDDNVYFYERVMVVRDDRTAKQRGRGALIRPGDSGSLVFRIDGLETDAAVKRPVFRGLAYVVGGQTGKENNSFAYCMRLDEALSVLQVEVAR